MGETLRSEWVRCGKRCGGCPHGPYWYAYWREEGRVRKRYVGKGDPRRDDGPAREGDGEGVPPRPPAPAHVWDAILSDRTATAELARSILGIGPSAGKDGAKIAYRKLAKDHHPDRNPGSQDRTFLYVQAAYSYLVKWMRW